MLIRCIFLRLLLSILLSTHYAAAYHVGLAIVATGKYAQFVVPLIRSARTHFCSDHHITYFLFTDSYDLEVNDDVVICQHNLLGWPKDTMYRCGAYARAADLLKEMDYVFACDADMLFVDTVGSEILSDRVATLHPGYYKQSGTPETRIASRAYIDPSAKHHYFAGGFYGGSSEEFLKIASVMQANINADSLNNIVAIWHDESHLNRYFFDNPPTCILSPSYCMPESKNPHWYSKEVIDMVPKLIALDKNHDALRVNV